MFVVAARRAGDVPADALPWLLAYTRRLIANRRRSSTRRAALLDRVRTLRPPAQAEPVDSTGRLTRGLARLSESDREVPMLIAWEGLDPERAARVLDCSRSAFAMRLHRARKRLAAALEQPATAAVPDHLPAHVDPEEVVLMDDLIAELTAENPVPACEAPPIEALWRKLDAPAPARSRSIAPVRWLALATGAVIIPVLIAVVVLTVPTTIVVALLVRPRRRAG